MTEQTPILHIIGGGEYGGAEQYLLNIAQEMADSPYQLHFACFYDREFAKRLRKLDIPVHIIKPKNRFDLSLDKKLAQLIRDENYQVIHTHGVRANLFGRLAVRRLDRESYNSPSLVTTVHSVLKQDYPKFIEYNLAYLLERYSQHMTDYFIAISNAIRDDMVDRGIATSKITTIHTGLNFAKLAANTSKHELNLREHVAKIYEKEAAANSKYISAVESLKIYTKANSAEIAKFVDDGQSLEDIKIIGMVGRLHKVKGHRYAIAAMLPIINKYPNAHLVIAGDGELFDELIELRDSMQLTRHVHFLGFRDSVTSIVRQFDIFLMPSLSEGLGLSLIEAMAEGIPAIASRVGGMAEVIQEFPASSDQPHPTGILIPSEDSKSISAAVMDMLADPDQARAIGLAGQRDVKERFTSDRMIQSFVDFYDRVTDADIEN